MASYIKTLKEDNGDITYPQTLASAVYTTGGTDVESALSSKASTTDLAGKIDIGDVQSTDIVANAVTTAKIADSAVTTAKIADGAVTSAKINWGSIRTILYQATSESTATVTTTLSDSPSNYDELEIWIAGGDGDRFAIKISPTATRFDATTTGGFAGVIYFTASLWSISGSTFTWQRSYRKEGNANNWGNGTSQLMWVYKVVGIKY